MDHITDRIRVSGVYHCERYTGVIVSSRANTAYTSGLQILYTVQLDTPIMVYGAVRTRIIVESDSDCNTIGAI